MTPTATDPSRLPGWSTWSRALAAWWAAGPERDAAARAVVLDRVAAEVAGHRGWSLPPAGPARPPGPPPGWPGLPAALAVPEVVGAVDELLVEPGDRRARGAHYTAPPLALALLAWALRGWGPPRGGSAPGPALRVVDPAVGGGAFLLAAARWQVARGADPAAVVAGLVGVDIDPVAVRAAEAGLTLWALGEGVAPARARPTRMVVGDGLSSGTLGAGSADLVVGNPPFLGQLTRRTARSRTEAERLRTRFGPKIGGYADTAALFLLAACEAAGPGGRVVLVLPESLFGARDGEAVRRAVGEQGDLVGLWVAGAPAFSAEVDVCAPVVEVPLR